MIRKTTPLILLVEDDAAAAEALQLILRDWGAEVIHGDGRGDLAAAAGPRLAEAGWIIADFNLGPAENGVTQAERLKAAAPSARVLVLSGSFSGRATAAAARAGFDVMQKPARAKSIIQWLERP